MTALAVYGTLAPGRANHHQLAALAGWWTPGWVRGWLRAQGWAAAQGFPGLLPDAAGDRIAVQLFRSPDLPAHWARLDGFEGPGYRRTPIMVATADGDVAACIYALA